MNFVNFYHHILWNYWGSYQTNAILLAGLGNEKKERTVSSPFKVKGVINSNRESAIFFEPPRTFHFLCLRRVITFLTLLFSGWRNWFFDRPDDFAINEKILIDNRLCIIEPFPAIGFDWIPPNNVLYFLFERMGECFCEPNSKPTLTLIRQINDMSKGRCGCYWSALSGLFVARRRHIIWYCEAK